MPPPSHRAANSHAYCSQAAKRCTFVLLLRVAGSVPAEDRPLPAGFAGCRTSCVAPSPTPSQAGLLSLERTFAWTTRLPRRQEKTDIGPDMLRPAPAPPLHKAARPLEPDLLNRMNCGGGSGKPKLPWTHGHAPQIRDAGPATPGINVARYRGFGDCMAFPPPPASRTGPGVADSTNADGTSGHGPALNRPLDRPWALVRAPRKSHVRPASQAARPPVPPRRRRSR